jgi:sulfatase maturation enzyme AslB (radical SAM superfamily)
MPLEWRDLPRFQLTVSIDGLQPEHDARRTPATYERILKNIAATDYGTARSRAIR